MLSHHVHAGASVLTDLSSTVVYVDFATGSAEANRTRAPKPIQDISASSAVFTRPRGTLVQVFFTIRATVTGNTATFEPLRTVITSAAISTYGVFARDRRRLAMIALESFLASTGVALTVILTCPAILTRVVGATAVQFDFTVDARVARRTAASVRALAGVEAKPVVLTRLMVGAVVEVLVAEQSAPALIADAIPLLLASAVQASRIPLAFITIPAGPSAFTSATIERKKTVLKTRLKHFLNLSTIVSDY